MAINTSNNKVRIISTTVSGLSTNSKFSDIKSPALVVNTSDGGVFYAPGDSSKLTQLAALPSHSHSYLPLGGGQLTGSLIISSATDAKLILNNTDTETKYQYISFKDNGTEYGTLGTFGDNTLKWRGTAISLEGHSHSDYLPLSGGSLSGYLSSSDYILGTGLIRVNASGSTTNFGYIKAETYDTNRSVVHIGSNYGGSASISNSVSYDAIGIYRTCVGIGGTFTGATLKSNYDAGIKLDVSGNVKATKFIGALQGNADTATAVSSFGEAASDSTKRYVWMSWTSDISKPAYSTKLTFQTSTNTLFVNDKAVSLSDHTHSNYLPKAGGTMTGRLTLLGGQYDGITSTPTALVGALDCNNSNIIGVNNITTCDKADSGNEGLRFYRTATTNDCIWAADGVLNFSPNLTIGATSGTTYTVYHSGNISSATVGSATTAQQLSGFTKRANANATWGTLTSTNGYTPVYWVDTANSGGIGISDKDQRTYFQIDGIFYQNEGNYAVLDTNTGAAKSHTHVMTDISNWGTYIYSATTSRTKNTVLAAPNGSNGSATFRALVAADLPVIPASKGGSGQTTLTNSANAYLNALSTGASDPVDADYYIAQYAGGGTATTTYHRRPVSALYNYIKGKLDNVYAPKSHSHSYLPLSGGTLTGNISYQGTKAAYTMIRFLDNTADAYGNGISIGGGGAVIIGGGEAASACESLVAGGDEITLICSDGNIEFYSNCQNGTSTAKKMTYNTSGQLTAANFITSSDKRLKTNIHEISNAKKSLDLNFYEFDYKDNDNHSAGHIAQEVKEILPEFVHEDTTEEHMLSIDYAGLHSIQIKALLDRIIKLEEEIKILKSSK